jgi:hypothetical protein
VLVKLEDVPGELHAMTRRLFRKSDGVLSSAFEASDAHFGAYMSRDLPPDCRLKFDIKPTIVVLPSGEKAERIRCYSDL